MADGGARRSLQSVGAVAKRRLDGAHSASVRALAVLGGVVFSAGSDQRLRVWQTDADAVKRGDGDAFRPAGGHVAAVLRAAAEEGLVGRKDVPLAGGDQALSAFVSAKMSDPVYVSLIDSRHRR